MNSWSSVVNKHLAVVFTIIVVLFMIMICLGIFWHAEHWETVKEKENLPGPIDISNITYKSDIQIKDEKRYFALSGFCYKLNERVQNFDISIALKEMGEG